MVSQLLRCLATHHADEDEQVGPERMLSDQKEKCTGKKFLPVVGHPRTDRARPTSGFAVRANGAQNNDVEGARDRTKQPIGAGVS